MDLELTGKSALVTGASKGIGLAIAQVLAREGCNLHLAARGEAHLLEVADQLRRAYPGVAVWTHPADLARGDDQKRLADECGAVDILVNNAGSNAAGDILATTDEVWRGAWDLKVFGYLNLTRAILEQMKGRGRGVIVNVIGYAGERLRARYIIGTTSNAALMAFTRSVGSQSPDFGVRVVGVNPGFTATERAESVLSTISESQFGTPDRWKEVLDGLDLPFGRMGAPEEIADAVAFLASARAAYISGTIVTVDGGATHRNG